jgi:carboxylate-amine ligase
VPIEAHFGESTPWSVGVEEELMVLDAETLALAPRADELIAAGSDGAAPGVLKSQLFASALELNSGVCEGPAGAADVIGRLRRLGAELAKERGLELAAAGTHPFSRPKDQEIAEEDRYVEFVEYAGISARRQGVSGLHVHVGMPSADACFHALEATLPWLPVILAMSANSPFLAGEETGLASNRAEVLAQLPRSGPPPAFRSYEDWEAFIERYVRLGVAADYTRFWWDSRPHPKFGTLEVRMPDQPTALERTVGFTGLLQALCAHFAEAGDGDPADRGVYQQNRWAALRHGANAELLHPVEDRTAPVAETAGELLEVLSAKLEELGTAEPVARLTEGDPEGRRQLEIGRAQGLDGVTADVIERTLVS